MRLLWFMGKTDPLWIQLSGIGDNSSIVILLARGNNQCFRLQGLGVGLPGNRNLPDNWDVLTDMVTHCICYNRSFQELKAIADQYGVASVEQLQDHIDFGLNCKLCHPYVTRMLETGKTEFEVITDDGR